MFTQTGTESLVDARATAATRARYDRLAPIYDWLNCCTELTLFHPWRKRLWSNVNGVHSARILEVGVGTGKNMPFYPRDADLTAIDLSPKMLARARRRAERNRMRVTLLPMDAQVLEFPDQTFDAVVASWVFCSVPNPVLGLHEVRRVCKADGRIVLLEHMRAENEMVGRVLDVINPLVVRAMGFNVNRRTLDNLRRAGCTIERAEALAPSGLVRLIVARPNGQSHNEVQTA